MNSVLLDQYDGPLDLLADLVEDLVMGMVNEEEKVVISVVAEQYHTNFKITVAPPDFGILVGRNGVHIESMRTLIRAMGRKYGLPPCELFVEDPDPSKIKRNYDTRHPKG